MFRTSCSLIRVSSFLLLCPLISFVRCAEFDPEAYSTRAIACPAINRVLNQIVNVTIDYININPSAQNSILMVHGWPSLWSSWGHQIEHFKNDYHLVAIDIRGFGGSSYPMDIQSSSTMADLTGDLTCVMEHLGITSSICLGHDWGSVLCYEAARRRPDVFDGVIGITVPYQPSEDTFQSIESILPLIPALAYQVFFAQDTSVAITELNKDIKRTLRGTLRSANSPPPKTFLRSRKTYMGAWGDIDIPPIPFFTEKEEDYFVHRFRQQGFDHTLMFYTSGNKYGTWKAAHDQGNFTIPQPVLSVLPLQDPVANWTMVAELFNVTSYLPQLTTKTMEGAHWPHMEFPHMFNAIMREWLTEVVWEKPASKETNMEKSKEASTQHMVIDEL